MKSNLFYWLLLVYSVSHGAVAVPFEGGIIGLFNITLKAGQTAYDLIDLKKRTNDSEYATQLIFKVGQALEEYTQMPMDLSSFDERTWKFFKTVVETDAQDLTTNSQRYFKDPSSFQERNLLRYCRHNQTLSTWFCLYTFSHPVRLHGLLSKNYEISHVQRVLERILNAMNELILSSFVCFRLEGQSKNEMTLALMDEHLSKNIDLQLNENESLKPVAANNELISADMLPKYMKLLLDERQNIENKLREM